MVQRVLVHHDLKRHAPELELLRIELESRGIPIIISSLRGLKSLELTGTRVYGLFLFEGIHVSQLKRVTSESGAIWAGIVPVDIVVDIVASTARTASSRNLLLVAHPSRLRKHQERRLEEIISKLSALGIQADYIFVGEDMGGRKVEMIVPLTFFKGHIWRQICGGARCLGKPCAPPLLEAGFRRIADWIAGAPLS